jgi:hypothetical protein
MAPVGQTFWVFVSSPFEDLAEERRARCRTEYFRRYAGFAWSAALAFRQSICAGV